MAAPASAYRDVAVIRLPLPILMGLARRSVLLWLGLRIMVGSVALSTHTAKDVSQAIGLAGPTSVLVVVVVVILAVIDSRVVREELFLANLGAGARVNIVVSAALAGILELAVGALVAPR